DPARAARAVVGASRSIPRASCLTQAIAGRWLLASYGHPSQVHIGAARDNDGRLELHAWLDCNGTIVIGGEEYAAFQALPDVFKRSMIRR
ncbi:MAG TPA: lasso peptide biosynthesis B2 protein, partial [Chloroflexota bacterium]